ncbi:Fibronectin type-III domain-containing protein [Trichoderma simmonsii]|uniref:Fibronectin type-III domain-containing protein n=1 Tax=Trichoderma simmonsii TaxID=1491479 RepID=A0A8G0PFC2_9HYPO|nr:Fibronectin type-III domain-containing protein [Trichoderma simmonsii]
MSWELPALTLLSLSAVGFWGLGSPQPFHRKALYILVSASAVLIDPRQLAARMYASAHDAIVDYQLDALLAQHFKMALTLGAVLWLLHRGWQTLWKPVPELINILGVDIPEPPDVSLAGIRSDAATLSWTRPTSNRPVQKYSIQVNGVHVGDSPGNEVAITVTGLKPNHFYNIRVVAVGPNNFQAGSALLRLRTFGKDGRPLLGNSRLPTNFTDPDQPRTIPGDDESDDSDDAQFPVPSVEAAPVLDGNSANTRDANGTVPGQRRNTINRRHSPSVASMDQPHIKLPILDGPELSLDELNCKFEGIRKEIEDTLAVYAKEQAEAQQQEEELKKEKERKRQMLKEKEEQTAQLKAMVRITMEQMRAAEKERAKKEQQLRDKEAKKSKVRDNVSKLESEIQRMKRDREGFEAQKAALAEKRDKDVRKLDEINAELLDKCAELEAELKDKGKQLQDLKAAREQLPDAHDEQWKEEDLRLRREWEARRKELHARWVAEAKRSYELDQQINMVTKQLRMEQANLEFFNQGVAPNPNAEFDMSPPARPRRLSQHGVPMPESLSSPSPIVPSDPTFQSTAGFANAGFGPALFMDVAAHGQGEPQTEAELREANGPLSPSAARSFLPSNIFDEMEEPDLGPEDNLLPEPIQADDDDNIQSPASASPPFNIFASPHGSSSNLPFPQYNETRDRRPSLTSLGLNHSATSPPATGHRLSNLLAALRNRGAKPADELGPAIGSLKPGQSQSFPRGTDEQEVLENRRKINFSSWMNRNSTGPDSFAGIPFSTSRPFSARRLIPFGNSSGGVFADRDADGSRPPSINSIDLPRPSTDSGSIWGVQGVQGEQGGLLSTKNRLWSPDNRWPSRSGSRRPSIHGSPSILTTTLASAEDVILDDDDLLDPQTSPSQIGVIGSRPPTGLKSINQRLNPTAPTFMGNFFRGADKSKSKDKSKDKAKEEKAKDTEYPHGLDDFPSEASMSRDTNSIHTQGSVAESHESLMLGSTLSNTPSDLNSNADSAAKDQDNVVMKLFRKGSSSKFGLSTRLGKDSGLFKKGPGSATNSDRNMSVDHRSSIGDIDDLGEDASQLGRSFDSLASSPSLGPSKSRESRESRMSGWRFSMKKKGKDTVKEKESTEFDKYAEEE